MLTAANSITFTDAVTTLLDEWHSIAYYPANGWPWPWPDSHLTDWICAFDHGSLAGPAVLQDVVCLEWSDVVVSGSGWIPQA